MTKATRQLPAGERRALGARMVARRRTKRWSQRELARRTGIRYIRLSKLENGHVTPSLPELLFIAEALDASLEELLRGVLPVEGLSARELKRLRHLTGRARKLQEALRLFSGALPPAPEEAKREIVRGRIDCVANDYLNVVVQSLEAAVSDAESETA